MNRLLSLLACAMLAACASGSSPEPWRVNWTPDPERGGAWVSMEPDRARYPSDGELQLHWSDVIVVTSATPASVYSDRPRVIMVIETLLVRPHNTEVIGLASLEVHRDRNGAYLLPRDFHGHTIYFRFNGQPVYSVSSTGPTQAFIPLPAPPATCTVTGQAWILSSPDETCTMPDRHSLYEAFEWWKYPELLRGDENAQR